ncbi:proliferation-associated protein 2G4 [Cryptosporidium andersoni]|uniref:Proliferation-associated protein 2G4 n=1 Tax=Cryptosporidium andersoni TaxID=117008 RepID=A0A1J4MQW4_9CRYT|nr:proliferation-associated protein 2G4 [Cryptosporidium andersoni]
MSKSQSEMGNLSEEEISGSLSCPDVITKYHTGAEILNSTLQHIIQECKPEADISLLCRTGDMLIEEKTSNVYNKKENGKRIDKGIAFPTCISVNEICGNYSPIEGESMKLKSGDLVKIDMGVHIDGYICVVTHTIVIDTDNITGKKADVLKAAYVALEAAIRTMKPGNTNTQVTSVMNSVVREFGCSMIQGVLSHQLKQHIIDGNKVIISHETLDEKVDEFEFEVNEVYGLDVIVSSGDGKTRESDYRTTVYKRAIETNYNLKSPISRQFLAEVNRRFPTLPFSLNMISDQKVARLGILECLRHNLLYPYPVIVEKSGGFVAAFKCTILILPSGVKRITGLPFSQESICETEYKVINEDLRALLATSLSLKKKKKKPKQPSQE